MIDTDDDDRDLEDMTRYGNAELGKPAPSKRTAPQRNPELAGADDAKRALEALPPRPPWPGAKPARGEP